MAPSRACFADVAAPEGRWDGIERPYSENDVQRLRGSVKVEHTLAQLGAEKFWNLLQTEEYIPALGALSGNQVCCLEEQEYFSLLLFEYFST